MNSNDIHHGPGEPNDSKPAIPTKTLKDLHAMVKEQKPNQPDLDEDTIVHPIITDGMQDPSYVLPSEEPEPAPAEADQSPPAETTDGEKQEAYQAAIDQLRDEVLDQLINFQDRIGVLRNPDTGINAEAFKLSVDYYNDLSRLAEQYPKQWQTVSQEIEIAKNRVRNLTVGTDDVKGGEFDQDIEYAKDFLRNPQQEIHYAFTEMRKHPTDRAEADKAFATVRSAYEYALNGAMQAWSQLPKRLGELQVVADNTVSDIVRYIRLSTDTDTYEFHRKLIDRTELYLKGIDAQAAILREKLVGLNTDCIDSRAAIQQQFESAVNLPE
jgi:hypothetical protein